MHLQLNIIDILAGINLILSSGSFFIAAGIISYVGQEGYILAKSWKYILPAILVFTITKSIDFFYEYGIFTPARFLREGILIIFSLLIFIGILVQYLAIKDAVQGRMR